MAEEKELSKKELRAQKRAEKQERKAEEEAQEKKEAFTQNIFTWGLVAILGIGLVLFVSGLVRNDSKAIGTESVAVVTDEDQVVGPADAPATLIEYGDFLCSHCRDAYPEVNKLMTEFGDDLRFIYRHFPIISPKSYSAAYAVEAAGKQGKYYEMYDLLFKSEDWAGATNTNEAFFKYAEDLGLDLDTFKKDYESKEVRDRVRADADSGKALGVTGTPAFFLNGKRVNVHPNSLGGAIKTIVDEAQAQAQDKDDSGAEANLAE